MEELAELIEKPTTIDQRYESWISDVSWKLIDAKAEARRCGDASKVKNLKIRLRTSLKADRKQRIEVVAEQIDALLAAKDVRGAYGKLRSWYREKPGHVPKPTVQDEAKTRSEYQALFMAEEPPGEPIAPNPCNTQYN